MTGPIVEAATFGDNEGHDGVPLGVNASDGGGERHRVGALQVAAIVAVALFAIVIGRILTAPTDVEVNGDEASYVYSALSLRGFDLSYDAADQARWAALGWEEQPTGLFLQTFDSGWAMAKPIGASVVLAPPLYVFGLYGIQVTGALLLTAYAACWYLSARLRWSRSVSAIVAVAASVASHVWFFAFAAHPDLFFAVLVGVICYGCLRAALRDEPRWFWLAAVFAGLLLTEKVPALLALLPILVATASLFRRRAALAGVAVLVVVGALSTLPYWYYSGGSSWSPYGGERFYAEETTPWSGGTEEDLRRVTTDEKLSPSFVVDRLGSPSTEIIDASFTYVVGRHTGTFTFLPLAPVITVAGAVTLLCRSRRRKASLESPVGDRHDVAVGVDDDAARSGISADTEYISADEPTVDALDRSPELARAEDCDGASRPATSNARATVPRLAWAAIASLVLYAAFYIVLFTSNYYGGWQTIGNRYFLQFSLVAVVVPVAAGVGERAALWCAAFAAGWALVVLGPLLQRGDVMFNEFWHTTTVQRLLPFDGSQSHSVGTWAPAGPFHYVGSEAPSQTGRVAGDSITAEEGRDAPGYLAYGPYRRLPPGEYVVTFRYSSSASPEAVVAVMDVARNGDSVESVELSGTNGELVVVDLPFTTAAEPGWEFRFLWHGRGGFALSSVRVERAGD